MKLTINPLSVYFSSDFVEFEINGVYLCGEFYEASPTGEINFSLSHSQVDDKAAAIYFADWENINEQLTYIYFNRPSQPDVDSDKLTAVYKGYSLKYTVTEGCEDFKPVYFAGFDIISPEGFSFGHLFDNHAEAIEAINYDIDSLNNTISK